jgi:hypothetical protein
MGESNPPNGDAFAKLTLHVGGAGGEAEEHQFITSPVPSFPSSAELDLGGEHALPPGFREAVAALGENVNTYLTGHVEVERAVRAAEREKAEALERDARDQRRQAKRDEVARLKRERKEARRKQATEGTGASEGESMVGGTDDGDGGEPEQKRHRKS